MISFPIDVLEKNPLCNFPNDEVAIVFGTDAFVLVVSANYQQLAAHLRHLIKVNVQDVFLRVWGFCEDLHGLLNLDVFLELLTELFLVLGQMLLFVGLLLG